MVVLFMKRQRWDHDGDYLHFTLAKENKDTGYAINILAKFLNIKPSHFTSSGIKDRRAVTAQRVSLFRTEQQRLESLNSRLRDFLVYDFSYEKEELKLGAHTGNRFSLILRWVPKEDRTVAEKRLVSLRDHGFINYFGSQRFGSCTTRTAEVGRLILARKWEEAIKEILRGPGVGSLAEALTEYHNSGDAEAAVKLLRGGASYASVEGQILKSLKFGKTWQMAILQLPRQMRSLYVHAYQSLLWNKVATIRAKSLLDKGEELDGVQVPLCAKTVDDEETAKLYEELLKQDDLNFDSFGSLEDRFALGASTRALLVKPGAMSWRWVQHEDRSEQLQKSVNTDVLERNDVKAGEEKEGWHLSLHLAFNLPPGAYATVALRELTACDMSKEAQKVRDLAEKNGDKEGDDAPIPGSCIVDE